MKNLSVLTFFTACTARIFLPLDHLHPTELKAGTYKNGNLIDIIINDIEPPATERYGIPVPINTFDLKNYGCWCQGTNWPHGKGQVVDDFDRICLNQYKGYECIRMDSSDRNEACDPENADYTWDLTVENNNFIIECSDDNLGNFCKTETCKVDLRSIFAWWEKTSNFYFPSMQDYGHVGSGHGSFDPEIECSVGGTVRRDKICCGDYPYRSWYLKTNDVDFTNNRECCKYDDITIQDLWNDDSMRVGTFYHSDIERCCPHGVVTLTGQC